ncbi:MAG: LysR family transcriptional regulator [Hyphomicrobiaceae bacterium]
MDQLRSLAVLVAVVEEGSFAAAASRLGLSRTMTSKHIADLEAHLGVRLLNRTTRRLSPTSTGEIYAERARQIVGLVGEADREAAHQSLTPSGTLRINAPMSFGTHHIAPHLRAYCELYPEVAIELTLNDRVVDLVDEGYDLAIRIGVLADSTLRQRRLATSRMLLCASPGYVVARGTPGRPEDLTRHELLGYAYGALRGRWRFQGPQGAVEIPVKSRLVCNNGDAMVEMAADGLGLILQPDFIVHRAIRAGRLVELLADYQAGTLGIHAVFPPSRHVPARVRTFIAHLEAIFQRGPDWRIGPPVTGPASPPERH